VEAEGNKEGFPQDVAMRKAAPRNMHSTAVRIKRQESLTSYRNVPALRMPGGAGFSLRRALARLVPFSLGLIARWRIFLLAALTAASFQGSTPALFVEA
jgi:hypothetical protein